MPTIKQRLAIDKIIENNGNISKAMIEAGYKSTTATRPKNLTNSTGFRELAEQYLPDSLLLKALHDDIKNKPSNRTKEIELGLRVRGRLNNDIQPNQVNFVVVPNELINKNNINATSNPLNLATSSSDQLPPSTS